MTTLEDLFENYDGSYLNHADRVAELRAELADLRRKAAEYDGMMRLLDAFAVQAMPVVEGLDRVVRAHLRCPACGVTFDSTQAYREHMDCKMVLMR